jgi:hypothetical protein
MSNESWRDEAIRRFPDHALAFREAESPYAVWIDLWIAFQSAYDSGNAALVADIYAFAEWCGTQPRGASADDDLATCVNVCFVEHIPSHPKALEDMPRWFTLAEVERMQDTLSYIVGPEGYAKVLARYAV